MDCGYIERESGMMQKGIRMFHWIKGKLISLIIKYLPTKKNRFLFTSYEGHYCDSPKYLSEAIHKMNHNVEIIWIVRKDMLPLLPAYVKGIVHEGIKGRIKVIWYKGTSRVWIDNSTGDKVSSLESNRPWEYLEFKINSFLRNKANQLLFSTWHGTPLKCMGRDLIDNRQIDYSCNPLAATMVHGNEYTLKIMDHLTFRKFNMKLLGAPRNDILFESDPQKKMKIKQKLGLPTDKKIILFAPTFRHDGELENKNIQRSGLNQLSEMNFNQLFESLEKKFGGEWVLVCRFHYYLDKMIDWDGLEEQYSGKIINGNKNDEMSEYLACTDILLTDASSCMFDFAITKKPCILYFPDVEYYEKKERGFYYPIRKLPFPLAVTFQQLLDTISGFDYEPYKENVGKMIEKFGYVDDGHSSRRIAAFILKKCFGKD